MEFGRLSNGAFDVTVGPLLDLWRQAQEKSALPAKAALQGALSRVAYSRIEFDRSSGEARLKAGTRLDLGGIAKGYIVGEAVKALKDNGIAHALIVAGGDLYALGDNPEHGDWSLGVRHPLKPEEYIRALRVTDKAVATSGHYMRFYSVSGRRYSHIINPQTGYPADNNVVSVTVIGPDGVAADALSTAISVLGPEKGLALVKSVPGMDGLVMTWDGKEMSYHQSAGFSKYLVP
jgi:thiamine biosynthesis lipoprotein